MSTLISWAYYGQKAWTFLFGEGKKRVLAFNLIYCAFIIIGSVMNVKSIIEITDAMILAHAKKLIDSGIDKKSAIKQTAQELNIQKRIVYSLVTENL